MELSQMETLESGSKNPSSNWFEKAKRAAGARFSSSGALVVETGKYTGRAVKERFVSDVAGSHANISWGKVNQAIAASAANTLIRGIETKLKAHSSPIYAGFVGPFPIQVQSASLWHLAFADNMFRKHPTPGLTNSRFQNKQLKVFHDPYGKASDYGKDVGFPSETLIVIDFAAGEVGIVGTAYAGEIKKSAFALCNYLLPEAGILSMHSSANCLADGSNSCVLFGLSGTGKTTLSAASDRYLIGDDEIVWSDTGLTNLEGGCYAKLIDLTEEREPEIFRAVNQSGAILENILVDANGKVNFADKSKTENTRGSYPLTALEKVFDQTKEAHAPKTVVFLTADAFGALPAVAKLDEWQTQFYFLSGYTAKVAGTELGVKEPQATFSTCFGAPFMPRRASVYAELLAKKVKQVGAEVWLLNTGWQTGGYGKAERFPLKVSRGILQAIQSGELKNAPRVKHPVFGFEVATECKGVDASFLKIPEGDVAQKVAELFVKNYQEGFQKEAQAEVFEKRRAENLISDDRDREVRDFLREVEHR